LDNRTEAQKASLSRLLEALKRTYPNAHIMGHRDIWGKSSSKWKKMCPCFDAEKEYAYLDEVKLEKYSDSTYTPLISQSPLKRESWLDKIKKLVPWTH
jgi:N-acetyl-anhydromuramyl-L-alanine amidase AmpD